MEENWTYRIDDLVKIISSKYSVIPGLNPGLLSLSPFSLYCSTAVTGSVQPAQDVAVGEHVGRNFSGKQCLVVRKHSHFIIFRIFLKNKIFHLGKMANYIYLITQKRPLTWTQDSPCKNVTEEMQIFSLISKKVRNGRMFEICQKVALEKKVLSIIVLL